MLSSGSFAASYLQVIAKGVLDPRCPGKLTCAVQGSTTRRPVPHIRTVKGLMYLVPPRTPRSSGYDVYAHVVYVVICYMSVICICLIYVVICYTSVICYMSFICLVLGPSCHMYMSVMRICVITYYYKVVVEPGVQLCTLLEVWVLGVEMSTLDTQCTTRIGISKYRWPWIMETLWGLNVETHCPVPHRTWLPLYRDSTVRKRISDRHVSVYPSGPH